MALKDWKKVRGKTEWFWVHTELGDTHPTRTIIILKGNKVEIKYWDTVENYVKSAAYPKEFKNKSEAMKWIRNYMKWGFWKH